MGIQVAYSIKPLPETGYHAFVFQNSFKKLTFDYCFFGYISSQVFQMKRNRWVPGMTGYNA